MCGISPPRTPAFQVYCWAITTLIPSLFYCHQLAICPNGLLLHLPLAKVLLRAPNGCRAYPLSQCGARCPSMDRSTRQSRTK